MVVVYRSQQNVYRLDGVILVIALTAFVGLLLTGCSNVGVRPTDGREVNEAHARCVSECRALQSACQPNDTACLNDYPKCLKTCERWSGLRSSSGGVSIDVPTHD
jgi:hypothetical protein